MFLYVCKQTFRKLYGYITREFLGIRMRNFQGIIFVWTRTHREIFKSALVQIWDLFSVVNKTSKNTMRLSQILHSFLCSTLFSTISDCVAKDLTYKIYSVFEEKRLHSLTFYLHFYLWNEKPLRITIISRVINNSITEYDSQYVWLSFIATF